MFVILHSLFNSLVGTSLTFLVSFYCQWNVVFIFSSLLIKITFLRLNEVNKFARRHRDLRTRPIYMLTNIYPASVLLNILHKINNDHYCAMNDPSSCVI